MSGKVRGGSKILNHESNYAVPGMPALLKSKKDVSFFEFWPLWLMYVPVALQWLVLAVRNRSLFLPLIANPKLPVSGFVGVGKSEIMKQATGLCDETILPWICYVVDASPLDRQADQVVNIAADKDIEFPFVCKPDLGCRGSGVKLIADREQLSTYLGAYPDSTAIIVQRLASWEPEAGVFYVRMPGATSGEIVSLALKYSPYVIGDGVSTLEELIARDSRASHLQHLYAKRHRDNLGKVIESGEKYRLVFSISHCRGAIFRDGSEFITPEMTDQVNRIMRGLPEFYYGRLDIKFQDTDSLMLGQNLEIVEINAASSESLHIWDRDAALHDAVGTLLWQYRTLFRIGRANRERGFVPPRIKEFLSRWRAERKLADYYPATD